MSVREEHRTALRALDGDPAAVRAYLAAGSGLPGPRANLELLGAFADVAPADLVRDLADDPDEYLRRTGAFGRVGRVGRRRAQRSGSNGRISSGVSPVVTRWASARPVAGPRTMPHMPWPPAT